MLLMRIALGLFLGLAAFAFTYNSALFAPVPQDGPLRLLAHRGVHQTFDRAGLTRESCTATRIHSPTHAFLENTLPSMQRAFDLGAEVVELDVHLTPNGEFAVFHDWRLECRTNGSGVTRAQPMPYLRSLDIGHGYTADGESFPFRGKAIGMMPTLTDVLEADLGGLLLINLKSRDAREGKALAALLSDPAYARQIFGVYGGDVPTKAALAALPDLRGFTREGTRACLIRYALTGWTGRVPRICRRGIVAVPFDVAPWLWGWPHLFTDRMRRAGVSVILMGPLDDQGLTDGIDTAEDLAGVPDGFDGLIWTNRIEQIAPLARR